MSEINIKHLSVLSAIIYNCWLFIRSGCNPSLPVYCRTNGVDTTARSVFCTLRGYFFVLPSSLPLTPHIKAVGMSQERFNGEGRLYVETTLVDFGKLAEKLEEVRVGCADLALKGRGFFWKGEKFAASNSRTFSHGGEDRRTTIYSVNSFKNCLIDPWLILGDLLYGYNCFSEFAMGLVDKKIGAEAECGAGDALRHEMMMAMSQVQIQRIVQEQLPVMTMSMRSLAHTCHSARILGMSKATLARHVERQLRENPFLQSR